MHLLYCWHLVSRHQSHPSYTRACPIPFSRDWHRRLCPEPTIYPNFTLFASYWCGTPCPGLILHPTWLQFLTTSAKRMPYDFRNNDSSKCNVIMYLSYTCWLIHSWSQQYREPRNERNFCEIQEKYYNHHSNLTQMCQGQKWS